MSGRRLSVCESSALSTFRMDFCALHKPCSCRIPIGVLSPLLFPEIPTQGMQTACRRESSYYKSPGTHLPHRVWPKPKRGGPVVNVASPINSLPAGCLQLRGETKYMALGRRFVKWPSIGDLLIPSQHIDDCPTLSGRGSYRNNYFSKSYQKSAANHVLLVAMKDVA